MILEAFGVFRSLFPFIKEAFLWRDGMTVGKPVTNTNLWKRQVATYLMSISLAMNYYMGHKLYKMAEEVVRLKKEIATLHERHLPAQKASIDKSDSGATPVSDPKQESETNLKATKLPKPHPGHHR